MNHADMNVPVMPDARTRPDPTLLMQVRQAALPSLSAAFAGALEAFDDSLFDRSDRAGSHAMPFLEAMRELRLRRPAMESAYREHLEQAWQGFAAGQPIAADQMRSSVRPSGGLSLVDDDELESRLAARNLSSVLGRECRSVLSRLESRLAWVINSRQMDSEANPFGPDHLAAAIQSAFGVTDVDAQVQLVLFKLCERQLLPGIQTLYDQLDAMLARAGALPELPAVPQRHRQETPVAPDSGVQPVGVLPQWAQRLVSQDGQPSGLADTAAALDSTLLLQALHSLLASGREQGRIARPQAPAATVSRELSQQEMLSVLSLLQASPEQTLPLASGRDDVSLAHRLKDEVLASAGRLGVDPSSACLGEADEDAIDLVGMLFDVILDERDLPGRSRDVIARLVVPFVKVALLDRRMFVQKTHPARRLLNALAEACEGNTGQTPAERMLMAKVEEVTDRLLNEFNENLAIFMTLEEEFRDFLVQHRRKVEIAERRAAETQRGQEKLEVARRRAAEEVARRAGPDLPTPLADFFGTAWRHHLTLQLLRETDECAPSVMETLALGDGLLEELATARAGQTAVPWLQSHQQGLERVFASVGLYGDSLDRSMAALRATLQAVAEQRVEQAPALPELPSLALPSAPSPEPAPVELEQAAQRREFNLDDAQRFRELEIGTWLDFVDKDGKVQAGKLSWISPISSRLLFVNRRGVRFCVASPEELAVMVRLGRLRQHENDGTFDVAMMGVIERLDSSPASAGATVH